VNAVRRPIVPGRQVIEICWQHYHYARHVQNMSNEAIMISIKLVPDLKPTQTEVIVALEQAFIAMHLGKK
jgi:hypothetical protein